MEDGFSSGSGYSGSKGLGHLRYVDPNRANYEGSHPLYRWHKDCVFVEQREVEEKDYMFVSDDSDEESSSDEDEGEEMPH